MQIVFDIETIREYRTLEQAPLETQNAWASIASKYSEPPEESYRKYAGLYPEFAQIACIVCADPEPERQSTYRLTMNETNDWDCEGELDMLRLLAESMHGDWRNAQLIGHNILAFDIPFIITRMLTYSLRIPPLLKLNGVKPWEMKHIDTRSAWKQGQFTTSQAANLDSICYLLRIPSPKSGEVFGSNVGDFFHDSEDKSAAIEVIADYCEADVRATAMVFNRLRKLNAL